MNQVSPNRSAGARVSLGRTAIEVTRLGFGAAGIAGLYEAVDDQQAASAVTRAWDLGIRYFDTAPLYGAGLAEERVGAILADHPRAEYVLSSKVGRVLRSPIPGEEHLVHRADVLFAGDSPVKAVADYTEAGVFTSLESSLERLRVDRLDIAFVHDPDDRLDEVLTVTLPALRRAREQGLVAAIGVGFREVADLIRYVREGDVDCLLVPGRYTLLNQEAARELLPLCVQQDVGVIVGGVYHGGTLSDDASAEPIAFAAPDDETRETVDAMRRLARSYGVATTALAVQFPLGHPCVSSVLVGARSPDEVASSVRAMEAPIPSELWEAMRAARLLPDDAHVPA